MGCNMINWKNTCCAWHGEYAEAEHVDGGMLRLKRGFGIDGILVMHFSISGECLTVNKDGAPDYKLMTESEVESIVK